MSAGLHPQIVTVLSNLRGIAREKIPQEEPLIIRTNYYENIRIMKEHNLFIYYAPFGHGKTHGVGLKLYHEALRGELKDTHDVIVFQLRNLEPDSNPVEILKHMQGIGVDPATAFIAASLVAGLSSNRCGHEVKSMCFSTFVEKMPNTHILSLQRVVEGLKREGRDYLIKLIKDITGRTRRKIILVFDEFESLITDGTFVQFLGFRLSALEFFSKLASLTRQLHDRNVRGLKVVLLVQEAVLPKRIWSSLENQLRNSGALGVTVLSRIEPYPARVYAEFIFEAVERLVNKNILRKTGWVSTLLGNKHTLIGELEKIFVNIKQIPPRIAFSIADDYIGMLAEVAKDCKDLKELKKKIKDTYEETMNRLSMTDEAIRLQYIYLSGRSIYSDKASFGNKENMIRLVNSLADEILRCGKWRSIVNYSTFYGIVCVEGIIRDELLVNVLLTKLKYSARTTIKKVSEALAKELTRRVGDTIESFIIDKDIQGKIKKVRIKIYPIIERKSSPAIFSSIAGAKNLLKRELSKRLAKVTPNVFGSRPNIHAEVLTPYVINEMKAIVLYTRVVAWNSVSFIKDYIKQSYKEIINEIKNLWFSTGGE